MDLWQASKLSFDICLKRNYLIDSGGGTRGQYQDLRDYSSSSLKEGEMTSENAEARRVEELAEKKRSGELSGEDLKRMYEEGDISKAERRQVIKLASKPALEKSARQILRDEVRKKKQQPREKLSAEQRKEKYSEGDRVDHEREKNAANFVVCLGCRKRGHFLKDCPKLAGGPMFDAPQQGQLVCFNCGSTEHALRACEKPSRQDGYLPFASCFLCKEKGHIARDCPNNTHGIYAKGGCCHVCGSTDHLARNCPERSEEDKAKWLREQEEQRQREEDRKLGPRIAGISTKEEEGAGGDTLGDDYAGNEVDSDDDEVKETKKRKSSKGDKKKSSKKSRDR